MFVKRFQNFLKAGVLCPGRISPWLYTHRFFC
jgi:hypothetical protein